MKTKLIFTCIFLLAMTARAQENAVALLGGYSFGSGSVASTQPTGWKLNLLYEYNPGLGSWSIGGSVGYISLSGSQSGVVTSSTYKAQIVPICIVPKFSFGSEKFKGYLKGMMGTSITTVSYTGTVVGADDNQWGMSFGLGIGATYFLNDRMFLSADYEWLRVSNIFADSGAINSATLGIGMKF